MLTSYVVFSINYFNLPEKFSSSHCIKHQQIKRIPVLHKNIFIATHKHDKSVAVLSFQHMFSPVRDRNLVARLSLYKVINGPDLTNFQCKCECVCLTHKKVLIPFALQANSKKKAFSLKKIY